MPRSSACRRSRSSQVALERLLRPRSRSARSSSRGPRRSTPRARSRSIAPDLAGQRAPQIEVGERGEVAPTVDHPAARQALLGTRADARQGPQRRSGARNAASESRRDDGDPAGLAAGRSDLGHDLRRWPRRASTRGHRRGAHRGLDRLGNGASAEESGARPARSRGNPRRGPFCSTRRHDLTHGPPTPPASTRGRARAGAGRRPPRGQRRSASAQLIAERIPSGAPRSSPSRRPRGPGVPPTTSGFERNSGCSRTSTAAKNASQIEVGARIAMMQA